MNEQTGQIQAEQFMRLTGPYHGRLHRIALALCGRADEADDLTQEALVRAFEGFDRYDTRRPVLPWLARILKNVFLNTKTSGRARFERAVHQLPREGDPYQWRASESEDPLEQVARGQLKAWLREAIEALEPERRLAVVL